MEFSNSCHGRTSNCSYTCAPIVQSRDKRVDGPLPHREYELTLMSKPVKQTADEPRDKSVLDRAKAWLTEIATDAANIAKDAIEAAITPPPVPVPIRARRPGARRR